MLEEIYDNEEIYLLAEYKMIEFFHFYMNLKKIYCILVPILRTGYTQKKRGNCTVTSYLLDHGL
jgi:hypothetical protein